MLSQHYGLIVEDMPMSSNAAIATIVENGDRDASSDIIFRGKNFHNFFHVSNEELDSTYLVLPTNNGNNIVAPNLGR